MTICAIIITYHPSAEVIKNIEIIGAMVDKVVVYDNTPGESEVIKSLGSISGIEVFHQGKNDGLGTALNFGLDYALEQHFDWLATFDQDSRPTANMFEKMLRDYERYPDYDRVRILAPRHLNPLLEDELLAIETNRNLPPIKRKTVITSGNLIYLHCIDKNLRFDEDLFIDSVDHDFCLKVLGRNEIILECENALLIHSIGDISYHRHAGVTVHATNHVPLRHYYMMRNRLYIWMRYFFSFPEWVISDIFAHLKMIARLLMLEEKKLLKLNYMTKGFLDFLRGKKGSLDD
ncbi:glycosyltransferase family 2 protein [Polynucleobacter yangtzensis]|uniref:Glycosyl transferase n=1 Tax=Polynucleobacter yangtzensis TaxID=1743159 RepID=A0ABM8CKR4_9BURK|nr:glycosyltransferase family 2 protein [Polynucleobacter yangtzensis]BDT78431.1 glycosyl transferase [Polynucleobacter yangtzensis]